MADNELTDIRRTRREISKECGDDPDRVFDYYEASQDRIKESGRYEFVDKPLLKPAKNCAKNR